MWSPDGKRLVSSAGYTDDVARVWDPTTGRKVFDIVGDKSSVTYSPDGSLLATGGQDGTTRLLDPTTGKELHSFVAKDGDVYALAFTPDGRFLVTGGRKALHVWDVTERKEARSIPNNGNVPLEIAFLRDGQSVKVRDYKTGTRVIDFATGREETPPVKDKEKTTAVAVSPANRYLADADQDGTTHLVDAVTGREILAITGPAPTQENPEIQNILGLAVSPDGRTVASAHRWAEVNRPFTNGEVRVYEVASGAELFRFVGHTDAVSGVRFSPDGSRLCSFADDHTLLIWDVTGARLAPAPAPKSADAAWTDLMSPDAKKGFAAIRYLSADPDAALRLVTAGVKPVASPDPKVVAGLIEKLGSSEFAEREGASKDLTELAPAVLDQLRAAGKSDSPEVRDRLGAILSKVGGPKFSGERLRALRAVEVLEHMGTPEARNVLTRLAAGASGATLTRAAEAALGRIKGTK
jgi:WD40 repeat protein